MECTHPRVRHLDKLESDTIYARCWSVRYGLVWTGTTRYMHDAATQHGLVRQSQEQNHLGQVRLRDTRVQFAVQLVNGDGE